MSQKGFLAIDFIILILFLYHNGSSFWINVKWPE